MRNLGLALALSVMMLAPHAVEAKKHPPHKRARSTRAAKAAKRAAVKSLPKRESDELASAVAEKRAVEKPVMTASAPAPARAAEPVEANAPLNMSNQVLDEEVPGSKKR